MALNQILVGSQQNTDGQISTARALKDGAAAVAAIHGKFYEPGVRGQVFMAGTVILGVAIPVAAATLNSKFTLWNPAGSSKNVELISITFGQNTVTTVANTHGLMIQRNLTGTSGIPTSLTAINIHPLGIGGVSVCAAASQATLTNVAIPGVSGGAVPIPYYPIWSITGITALTWGEMTHNFDGKIILGPDSLCAAVTSASASTAQSVNLVWAEWPI